MSGISRVIRIARISRIVLLAPFTRYRRFAATAASVVIGMFAIAAGSGALNHGRPLRWHVNIATGDYASRAARAVSLLEHRFYNGTGLWHMCFQLSCSTKNRDSGSDSLAYLLYFRWMLTKDRSVPPIMRTLASTAHA